MDGVISVNRSSGAGILRKLSNLKSLVKSKIQEEADVKQSAESLHEDIWTKINAGLDAVIRHVKSDYQQGDTLSPEELQTKVSEELNRGKKASADKLYRLFSNASHEELSEKDFMLSLFSDYSNTGSRRRKEASSRLVKLMPHSVAEIYTKMLSGIARVNLDQIFAPDNKNVDRSNDFDDFTSSSEHY